MVKYATEHDFGRSLLPPESPRYSRTDDLDSE